MGLPGPVGSASAHPKQTYTESEVFVDDRTSCWLKYGLMLEDAGMTYLNIVVLFLFSVYVIAFAIYCERKVMPPMPNH